ncbi:ImuA family protein [Aporhodopirellula aestuarii]|uniref:Cell division inhibitor SulA n=1 Tax=Aporhodopirellula aestuarii TaxID=2950107 RepID=A0ABT0U1U9_9BACT|nr:cell division inhibitor SulA [Aporhodopirellula aestuarii]MCM2370463.1 cell division inhibitor SulA [Aporhodopirellula aestuarii]
MPGSKTPVSKARKPLAQQTFAFWEPAGNPCDRRVGHASTSPEVRVDRTPPAHSLRKRPSLADSGALAEKTADEAVSGPRAEDIVGSSQSATPLISRESLMADLRGRAAAIASNPAMESAAQFSTGSPTIDSWLPGGGLKRGWICEWVAGHDASGASTLAMLAASSTIRPPRKVEPATVQSLSRGTDLMRTARVSSNPAFAHGGPIIVVDPTATFHAAAAIACGISPQRIVVCRCRTRADAVWAMDQSLRCSSVAAVWATLPWNLNDRDARRLQLAAEVGRTPGLFVLQSSARVRPSFAAVRLHVASVAVDASQLSADQRVAAGLPVRPPLDLRVLHVSLDRARGQRQNEAFLAVTPDARLHTLSSAAVAQLQTPQRNIPTPAGSRHEAVAVPLAARLADPTSTHRGRDAGTGANRRVG